MGKRHMGEVRVHFDGYDVGTAATQVTVNLGINVLDPTVITDAGERVTDGVRTDQFNFTGLFDDSQSLDAAAKDVLGSGSKVVSMYIGTSTGDIAYCGLTHLFDAPQPVSRGELVRQEATFRPDQAFDRSHVVAHTRSVTGSANSGSVDNGTRSPNGGTLYIHVFTLSGTGSGTIQLQDSANGTSFSNVTNMVFNPTGTGGTAIGTTGTIRRYRRLVEGTGTSTTFTYSAALGPRSN